MRRGALVLVLSCLACGQEAGPPGVEALYGPIAGGPLSPYPSNRYAVAASTATGLRVSLGDSGAEDLLLAPELIETVKEIDAMDGFSTSGGVVISFDGPIDTRGLAPREGEMDPIADASRFAAPGSPLVLVDVDPDSPERGRARGLVLRWWEQTADAFDPVSDYTLVAQPAEPLRPRTRYAFAVTRALRARDGGPVRASPATEALLAGGEGAYGASLREGLAVMAESLGIASSEVVLASTFTTASVHQEMVAMANRVRALEPKLLEPFSLETPLADDGRVRFRAVYEAPEFRRPLPDGRFEIEAETPVVQETVGLELFVAFSDALTSEPRPVVIFGHGLGGDKDGCWGTAQRLAELNVAVFAIDSPHHGARAGGAAAGTSIFRFFGIDPSDSTFVIGRARDNFRQMAADQLALVRLVASLSQLDILPPGAPDGIPDLDTSRILYIGHSFGAVQGPNIAALAPEIQHLVWNVGGANLTMLLRDSGTFSLLVNALKPPGTPDGALGRFFAVSQAIMDPGDPINFARFATLEPLAGVAGFRGSDLLLQEVIADTIVPNSTTRALARAAGLTLVDPLEPVSGLGQAAAPLSANLPSGATGGLSQFDVIDGKLATHGELIFSPEGRAQYLEFFRTALSGAAVVAPPAKVP